MNCNWVNRRCSNRHHSSRPISRWQCDGLLPQNCSQRERSTDRPDDSSANCTNGGESWNSTIYHRRAVARRCEPNNNGKSGHLSAKPARRRPSLQISTHSNWRERLITERTGNANLNRFEHYSTMENWCRWCLVNCTGLREAHVGRNSTGTGSEDVPID